MTCVLCRILLQLYWDLITKIPGELGSSKKILPTIDSFSSRHFYVFGVAVKLNFCSSSPKDTKSELTKISDFDVVAHSTCMYVCLHMSICI